MRFMLHSLSFFYKNLRIYFLLVIMLLAGCKTDTSTDSEEEIAYMTDYESPSAKWGFMNPQGELAIKADYDEAGSFSEGMAAINKNGKWGFINKDGNMVIKAIYKSAWAFHQGFARVLPFDQADQFIDRNGNPLTAEDWSAADDFSEGRARVKVGNTFGYIDPAGQLVIQPIYTRGWNFSNGICVVEFHEKIGLINMSGEYVLQPEFDQIKKSAADRVLLCRKGNLAVAYDNSGKEIMKIDDAKMIDSNGDLISIRKGNTMYLVSLSQPGKKSAEYSNIIYLEQDLWAGKTDSGYIVLDKTGNSISDHTYNQINKFSEGIAAYNKKNYWGYLDTTGQELTGELFGLAWDYREGFARAAFKEGIAFIDKNQKLAFYPPAGALDMRDFSEGLAAVQID